VPLPGIDQLLIASALDGELRRRILETPEEAFRDFDLSEEEKDILRRPDHRMLALLGTALARQAEASDAGPATPAEAPPGAVPQGRTLPDVRLVLTLVPCAQYENGTLTGFKYAAWVNSLPEGTDPATLPPPPGAALPGQPLAPLHAVIHVSALELRDTAGNPAVGLWASLRQSTNIPLPPPPETAGRPEAAPFARDLGSAEVRASVAAVRSAVSEERYDRLLDLMHVLRSGDVR